MSKKAKVSVSEMKKYDSGFGDDCFAHFTARRDKLGGTQHTCGSIDGRQVIITMRVPRCHEDCKMLASGECVRPADGRKCPKVVTKMLPVLGILYTDFADLDDIDVMNVGLILVPAYVQRTSLYFGIGKLGGLTEKERQKMVSSYDTKIMALVKEFKKKLDGG